MTCPICREWKLPVCREQTERCRDENHLGILSLLLSPPERNNRAYFFLFLFFFQYQYQWSYGLLICFFAGLGFGRLCSASSRVAKRRLRRTWIPPPLSVKRTKNSPPEQRLISTSRMVQLDSMIYALSPIFMEMITSLLSYDIFRTWQGESKNSRPFSGREFLLIFRSRIFSFCAS